MPAPNKWTGSSSGNRLWERGSMYESKDLLIRKAVTSDQKEAEDFCKLKGVPYMGDRGRLLGPSCCHRRATSRKIAVAGYLLRNGKERCRVCSCGRGGGGGRGEAKLDALFVDPNMRRRRDGRRIASWTLRWVAPGHEKSRCPLRSRKSPLEGIFTLQCGSGVIGTD